MDEASFVRVKTAQGEQIILLGPTASIDNLRLNLKPGDTVTLTTRRFNHGGTDHIVATDIDASGRKTTLWDNGPAWDRK
jgi:hypothetical protein